MKSSMRSEFSLSTLVRFCFVGGGTAILYLGLVGLLYRPGNYSILVASAAASITALGFNYLCHYHWTFAADSNHNETILRYLLMSGSSLMLNILIMHVGVSMLMFHFFWTQVVAALTMICWNLGFSWLWVYRETTPK